jgi:hypothetical protein
LAQHENVWPKKQICSTLCKQSEAQQAMGTLFMSHWSIHWPININKLLIQHWQQIVSVMNGWPMIVAFLKID